MVVLQFVHKVCPSPLVGDIPPIETLPDPPEAAATAVASPGTDNLRSTLTPPDVPMLVLPLRYGPTPRTPNNMCNRRRAELSPRIRVERRRECMLRRPRSSSVRTCHVTRTIPTPNGASLREMSKRRAVALHSVGQPTRPPPRIFGSTWLYCFLMISGPGSGGRCSSKCSSSRVEPTNRLIWEHVDRRHPAEVERIEPAKRRIVHSKREHTAFCIRCESANGCVHGRVSCCSSEVLCASGRVRGGRGGQLIRTEVR